MENIRNKYYCIVMCFQCILYAGYLFCLNQLHIFIQTEERIKLDAFSQWADRLFFLYVIASILVLWQAIHKRGITLKETLLVVNGYHLVLFMISFLLELVMAYVYFKPIAYLIQAFMLWIAVNLAALVLYGIGRLRR